MPPSIPRSSPSPMVKQNEQSEKKIENKDLTKTTTSSYAAADSMTATNNAYGAGGIGSMMYGAGGGMYGGGGGMYGGYGGGMYGGGMYGGMYGMPPGVGGPLSGLNQFLFGIQNVVFSLGQAVQIVSMNTQAIQQLLDSASTMLEHAVNTYREMRALEAHASADESPEDKKRRRRLRALRWAMICMITYAGYRVIRLAFSKRKQQRQSLPSSSSNSGGAALPSYNSPRNWNV